jgi:hypothetical protein
MTTPRRRKRIEIHSWDEVPAFADEDEEAAFWAEHSLGQELLAAMTAPSPGLLPPARGEPGSRGSGAAVTAAFMAMVHQIERIEGNRPPHRAFDFLRYTPDRTPHRRRPKPRAGAATR